MRYLMFYCPWKLFDRIFYPYFTVILCMAEFLPLDPILQRDEFYQMNINSMQWHVDELMEKYGIDVVSLLGVTAKDIVDNSFDKYLNLKPWKGVVYLLSVDGDIAGMLALTKLNKIMGELHRMWIRPEFRGNGYSRLLLQRVLEAGREMGLSVFRLSTPRFASAAQHLYRKNGFVEIDEYPETEVAAPLRKLWIYMEKDEFIHRFFP